MSQSQVAFLESSFINKLSGTFQQYTDSKCAFQAPFLKDSRAVVVQKLDPAQMETLHLHFFYTNKLQKSVWLQKSKVSPMLRIIKPQIVFVLVLQCLLFTFSLVCFVSLKGFFLCCCAEISCGLCGLLAGSYWKLW